MNYYGIRLKSGKLSDCDCWWRCSVEWLTRHHAAHDEWYKQQCLKSWSMHGPLPRKKWIFHLKSYGMLWCILSGTFVRVLTRRMLNFPLEEVIWWTLKMHFLEIVNTLFKLWGLISFLLHYCIIMQAIWCVKFWNMTKSGGQFALASPSPNSGGLVSLCPLGICAHGWLDGNECMVQCALNGV